MSRPFTPRWAALLLIAMAACDTEERVCYPADFVACVCDDGRDGYAQCDEEGAEYGECGFCGTAPGLAPTEDGGGGSGGGALLAFMAECEENEQCETGLCFEFPAKGPHCSHPCEVNEDCEFPSPGCNMMGVCKAP